MPRLFRLYIHIHTYIYLDIKICNVCDQWYEILEKIPVFLRECEIVRNGNENKILNFINQHQTVDREIDRQTDRHIHYTPFNTTDGNDEIAYIQF